MTGNKTNINLPGFTDQFKFAPGAQLDVFGKPKFTLAQGVFESKQTTSRQLTLWEERLFGCIMNVSSLVGTPVVGDTVTGDTSGKTGTITAVAGTVLTYSTKNNDFTDTETLTIGGVGGGATAVLTNHNTGADIEYQYFRASSFLNVGIESGQRVIRQTREYFTYTPKKGQVVDRTCVLAPGQANLLQFALYGDDLNAAGFCLYETVMTVVTRTNTSGTPVTTFIPQSTWNVDRLDGNGPSGLTLDPEKIEIFENDIAWLAAGNGRYILSINGTPVLVHIDEHANKTNVAWLRTASLPLRFEIQTIGPLVSPATLEQICCSVESDGGYEPPGFEFSVGNENTRIDAITKTLLLAVRLKDNCPDTANRPNRKQVKYQKFSVSTKSSDVYFELIHLHGPYTETGGTWNDLWGEPDIGVEYSTDFAFAGGSQHEIDSGYAIAGLAGSGGSVPTVGVGLSYHDRITQNFESNESQVFLIFATRDGASGTPSAAATFGGKILE